MLHQKFEYKIVSTIKEEAAMFTEEYFNEMGQQGWEYVTTLNGCNMLFKRGFYDD